MAKIPSWKVYLYNLRKRFMVYFALNRGLIRIIPREKVFLIKSMSDKYLTKEERGRLPKTVKFCVFIDRVVDNMDVFKVTRREVNFVRKYLYPLKRYKFMEMRGEILKVKRFAKKELKMSEEEISSYSSDQLIIEMIKRIDPKESYYSPQFVEWYDELDDKYFEKAEGVIDVTPQKTNQQKGVKKMAKKSKAVEAEVSVSVTDLKELVDQAEDKEELEEIIEENEDVFDGFDIDEYKTVRKMKKALNEFLDELKEELGDDGNDDVENNDDNEDEEKVAKNIIEAENIDELKAIGDEFEVFDEIKYKEGRGRGVKVRPLNDVKREMLKAMEWDGEFNLEEKEEEEEKPVKEKAKRGRKPNKVKEEEETSSLEITEETINDAITAKDLETLLEMAEEKGIKLGALEKGSYKRIGNKLLEHISTDKKEKDKKEKDKNEKEVKVDSKSAYQVVEEMLIDEADDDEILEVITPILTLRGKSKVAIKKWFRDVKAIVEADYDL